MSAIREMIYLSHHLHTPPFDSLRGSCHQGPSSHFLSAHSIPTGHKQPPLPADSSPSGTDYTGRQVSTPTARRGRGGAALPPAATFRHLETDDLQTAAATSICHVVYTSDMALLPMKCPIPLQSHPIKSESNQIVSASLFVSSAKRLTGRRCC
jgi:hypothetical protein